MTPLQKPRRGRSRRRRRDPPLCSARAIPIAHDPTVFSSLKLINFRDEELLCVAHDPILPSPLHFSNSQIN